MKKIISLFKRNMGEGEHHVYDEVTPGAEWVIAGEGRATRKWDGTGCLVRDGKLYKRYTLKKGRTAPENFEPVTEIDPNTGKQEGWVPVGDESGSKWHREAWDKFILPSRLSEGTYELVGPRVQANPERFSDHTLMRHGATPAPMRDGAFEPPRDFEGLCYYFCHYDIEGIVWHHPDGRMVKIKGSDFGIERPTPCGSERRRLAAIGAQT